MSYILAVSWCILISLCSTEVLFASGYQADSTTVETDTMITSTDIEPVDTVSSETVIIDASAANIEEEPDYAELHIYRISGAGAAVSYDLYLGDSVICRVNYKFCQTIRTNKDGLNTIWAKTESKKELPVNINYGEEYYIRCAITLGIMVGRPSLELVDNETGAKEFAELRAKRLKKNDIILLKDGREVECVITNEDDGTVYFTIERDGKKIQTKMDKSKIENITRFEDLNTL